MTVRRLFGLDRPITWLRITRDALVLLGIIASVTYWLYLTTGGGLPVDVHAYWAADPDDLYRQGATATSDAYLYPPTFELVAGWWRGIPFEAYAAIWRAALLATLVWLAGPFTLFALLTVPVASEVNAGNIQIPLAAAVVLGFRWPAAWAFVLLTKVTPGVGLLWFLLRRRWRAVTIAGAVTASIGLASFALSADEWFTYIRLVTTNPAPSVAPYYLPLWMRLPAAIAVIAWGAWTGRRWPVVVGATIALPVYYITSSAMLVGVLPFARQALGRWLSSRADRSALAPRAAHIAIEGDR